MSAGDLMHKRLSLAGQFMLTSLAIMLVGMLIIGAWVGQQIEGGVLSRTAAITALYVDSIVTPYLQTLVYQPHLTESEITALDRILTETALGERIVAFKVWSLDGEVLYSPNRALIGRSFAVRGGLARALDGEVVAHLSDLGSPENEYERQQWKRLLEVYVPVREHGSERIITVTEFYQLPDELEQEIAAARLRSWVVVAGATFIMYILLAGIVKRGSDTIIIQQAALRQKIADLSELLEQNARLRERVQQAAGRTTTLNEQALRRISADLHDGPGQVLALALLRLDALEERCAAGAQAGDEFSVVRGAIHDALGDIRVISAGLRLPELVSLTVAEIVERAVRDHQRRAETLVEMHVQNLPAQAPLPIKIALFRSIQEALSNATRHGGGIAVSARVWAEDQQLCLAVSDRGPGFVPEQVEVDGRLGLAGMRERAELLGGSFQLDSTPGRGTTIYLRWPLSAPEGV